MVEVTKGSSGNWWRMTYKGQVDYLDTEPTEGEKAMFRGQVDAAELRAKTIANLPPIPADRKTAEDYR